MSTPTVKFQIVVPSNVNGEATEKVYTLTLSLLVEASEGEVQVTLQDAFEPVPLGIAPPPEDPPKTQGEVEASEGEVQVTLQDAFGPVPLGIAPPPEDPPTKAEVEAEAEAA